MQIRGEFRSSRQSVASVFTTSRRTQENEQRPNDDDRRSNAQRPRGTGNESFVGSGHQLISV